MTVLLSLEEVTVQPVRRDAPLLRRASLQVDVGERVAVLGAMERSGSSALLRVLAGALPPDGGRVLLAGTDLYAAGDRDRSALLRDMIGLADPLSLALSPCGRVLEALALGLLPTAVSMRDAEARARHVLAEVGALACAERHPGELTRREQVRVAIARALVRDPKVLLVDEPAALPDPDEVSDIFGLLRSLARGRNLALVVATQDAMALTGGGWDQVVHASFGELTSSQRDAELLPFRPRSRSA